jgi:hypothetical protein
MPAPAIAPNLHVQRNLGWIGTTKAERFGPGSPVEIKRARIVWLHEPSREMFRFDFSDSDIGGSRPCLYLRYEPRGFLRVDLFLLPSRARAQQSQIPQRTGSPCICSVFRPSLDQKIIVKTREKSAADLC